MKKTPWTDKLSIIISLVTIGFTFWGIHYTSSQTKSAKDSAINSKSSSEIAKKAYNLQVENSQKDLVNKVAVWDADRHYNGSNKNKIIIQNQSNLPIYDVSVFIVRNDNKNNSIKKLKIDQNEYSFAEVYPPNETAIWLNGQPDNNEIHDSVAMTFRDANGKYWYRNVQGYLKEITKKDIDNFYKQTGINPDKVNPKYSPHIIIENK